MIVNHAHQEQVALHHGSNTPRRSGKRNLCATGTGEAPWACHPGRAGMHVMTVHFLCLQEQEVSLEAELARLEDEVAALDWGGPGKLLLAFCRFVGSANGV